MSCILPSFTRPARVRNAVFTRYASLSILRLVWRRLIVLSVYLALLGAFFLIGVPRANAGAGPHVIDDAGVETPGAMSKAGRPGAATADWSTPRPPAPSRPCRVWRSAAT
ncbi:hypothetical protein [Brevundimonas sp.]|uniref:hypothetical protein n=1 Tax=Brevundimonas sp. TaxID=1871086 RepID=UPI0025BF3819|nr:hypothetical protein [Brevundimonas sp.]